MTGTGCFFACTAAAAVDFPAPAADFPGASALATALAAASPPASSWTSPSGSNGLSFSAATSAAFSSRYFVTVLSITSSGTPVSVVSRSPARRVSKAASLLAISPSSFGRRLAFDCTACNSRGELITRWLFNKASTTVRDPDTARASSDSSATDGSSQSRVKMRSQIFRRNELSQHLGARLDRQRPPGWPDGMKKPAWRPLPIPRRAPRCWDISFRRKI